MNKGRYFIGTSGWHYKHWVGKFYPEKTSPKGFMPYYLKFFKTAEINNSFYKLPKEEVFREWKNSVPEDFIFSVKASRYITHMKKLKDPHEGLANFFRNADALGDKLGPILFQLPPGWNINIDRFKNFVKSLPSGYRYVFEFRNHSWYSQEVVEILNKNRLAFCIYELEGHLSPLELTTDFAYVRLHGPEGKYQGSYDEKSLDFWGDKISDWTENGKDVYFYFDNDQNGYAAENAKSLLNMVKERVGV